MQPRAYRCRTAVHDFRNLVRAVALDIVQPHGGTQIGRQRFDRLPERALLLAQRRGGIRGRFQRRGALPPRRAPQINAAVQRHAQQPCLEMFTVAKRRRIAQQTQKNILINVLRVRAGAEATEREPVHGVAVSLHRILQECVLAQFI